MKILTVDDEVKYTRLIKTALEMEGHEVVTATTGREALECIDREQPALVCADISMPGMDGLALLDKIGKMPSPKPDVIMISALSDTKTAVQAMKLGAFEYVTKPFEMDELSLLVQKVAEKRDLVRTNAELKKILSNTFSFGAIVGASPAMKSLFTMLEKVKDLETLVLIRGSSGTGKELVAKALHFQSLRRERPFVAINCSAVPETLLESELFGHKKGAFTGADRDREGTIAAAGSGTLFLDEIGDIAPEIQVKLLRVIQEREYIPVGAAKAESAKARIIAATNRDLEEAVAAGDFREDLYHRLNVFPVFLPSLSERRDDIPALVGHFLKKCKYTGPVPDGATMAVLMDHTWPGNVRELENCIERAVILAGSEPLRPGHFLLRDYRPGKDTGTSGFTIPDEGVSLDHIEKHYLLEALKKAGGNKTKAADLLSISRRAIYSKMKTHGIA
ncbi:MAG: hypothetical protein A2268_05495 [Candidatus Raymondbacteria bacterium RifOxyA12_full_50_37]|uniref:Fis family transcriptional regulator n=1 Tax=Candidatus Raymondbacteria bacterium RIFOXYD12_FULL_49_13 TaxID=1817890 RepID=A0A1F7FC04_UNCRA|nr:MAG: hypothetical protein A2268_05495 [Candidatus Raymondbacteria bacterium RifOxyA12_full_50_37]OGJ89019.1 MAG: hypothetical protein A2248_02730 [Candidatus Raymondbacteria bacterium RIFOXYA2_FULL_49_16]OGJ97046.1 MAG: hypothetical protein A2453_04145 [Candidatus Raymondbacteria bacterium RIFOXYC2_FULL_50_21]OGK04042.1 MAG: hypothetical protein A2519_00885 [Candidatus Raymondbacteria bacterium RIFOXYD12_FULL_49_13]OGP42015.1 MAG: hypothetical protein A2324_17795 [Candidatus Raymondbacteria 